MSLSRFWHLIFDRVSNLVASKDLGAAASPAAVQWVVLGLGNPGLEYEATRHNIGDRVVRELGRRHGTGAWIDRGDSLEHGATIDGRSVVLARPLTFMNRSGRAADAVLKRHRVPIENLLVVVDDIDLPLGRLRLKRAGGPGTHNGLRDIVKALGTGFPRLRMGIKGGVPGADLADYVLSTFDGQESADVEESVQRAADGVEQTITNGVDSAMGEVNRKFVSQSHAP